MAVNTQSKRPPVALNPSIPLEVARELRKVASFAFNAQDNANSALAQLPRKVANTPAGLTEAAQGIGQQLQSGGSYPLKLFGLPGLTQINGLSGGLLLSTGPGVTITTNGQQVEIALLPQGPGAGTYTVGAKLTSGGSPGTITIDDYGRITAIHQAS